MQGRIKLASAHLEHVFGYLLDALSNPPTVHRFQRQRFQNQDFECALDKVSGLR